jgi:hypothetical protein
MVIDGDMVRIELGEYDALTARHIVVLGQRDALADALAKVLAVQGERKAGGSLEQWNEAMFAARRALADALT